MKHLVIFFVFLTSFVFSSTNINLTQEEIDYIANKKIITVSNEKDYEPIDFIIDGKPAGYSIDLIKLLLKDTGLEIKFVTDTWTNLFEDFKQNKIDLVHTLYKNKEREEFANFSKGYLRGVHSFILRKDSEDISRFEELYGKKVGVTKGWYQEGVIKNYPEIERVYLPNLEAKLDALFYKKIDAFINNKFVAQYYIKKYGYNTLKVSNELEENIGRETSAFHFATLKDEPHLINIINKAFLNLPIEEHEKLMQKWFGGTGISKKEDITSLDLILSPKENSYLANKKIIKMPTYENWRPFNFKDGKKQTGYLIDLTKLMANKLGIKLEFINGKTWPEHMQMLKEGEVDLIGNMVLTKERQKTYSFSDKSTLTLLTGIISFKNYKSINDFKNTVIGVQKDSIFDNFIKEQYPNQKVAYYKTIKELITALVNNEIEGFIENYSVANYVIDTTNLFNEKVSVNLIEDKNPLDLYMYYAVNKNEPILLSIINKAYNSIPESKIKELKIKWGMINDEKNINTNTETNYKNFLLFLSIAVIIILLILAFYDAKLRKNQITKEKNLFQSLLNQFHKQEFSDINLFQKDSSKYFYYLLALLTIVIISLIINNFYLSNNSYYGEIINKSGKQRMLSQRLIIKANDYLLDRTTSKEYEEHIKMMEDDHNWIVKNLNENEKVFYIKTKLNYEFDEYISMHKMMLKSPNKKLFLQLVSKSNSILKTLDNAVKIHETEYNKSVEVFQIIKYIEAAFIILILYILWHHIFKPNLRKQEMLYERLWIEKEHALKISQEYKKQTEEFKTLSNELNFQNKELIEKDKELNSTKAEFENLFFSAPVSYIVINHHNEIVKYNNAADNIFKFSQYNSKHINLLTLLRNNKFLEFEKGIKKSLIDKKRFEFHLSIEKEEKIFMINAKKQENSNDILISFNDITEKEKLLQQYSEARKAADNANEAKSQFLANMSHEIRTPLNGIIGLNQILQETNLDDMQKEYMKMINHSSYALLNIINDILDYSKIEAGKLEIVKSEFKLHRLIKTTADLFSYTAQKKGLEFITIINPSIPQNLIGDSLRITQILNNLVSNAIKFTEEGFIKINVEMIEKKKSNIKLKISVKDSGIGISKEKQKKLFKKFEQGDSSTTKKFGGTGLGLVISKQLTLMMNGEINLKSKQNEGSEFSIEIPLQYIPNQPITQESNNLNYLIVDDSELERDYIKDILLSWGVKSTHINLAKNADEALNLLKVKNFDMLLIDWYMPKIDGFDLIETIKKEFDITPKIFMVTVANKEKVLKEAKSRNLNLDRVLSKPFTPSDLFNIIYNKSYMKDKTIETLKLITKDAKHALIVDDNETNQTVASQMLKSLGITSDITNDGYEAVNKCVNNNYDIIFMDIQMPIMDGYEATRRIREEGIKTPIIALSAAAMEKDKEFAIEAGMDNHLAKPIIKKDLENIISNYFVCKYISSDDLNKKTEIPDIEGVDITAVLSNFNYDEQKVINLYLNFAQSYGNIDFLKDISSLDEETMSYIHKLKGASGNLHIDQVFALCEKIEKEKDINFFHSLYNELNKINTLIFEKLSSLKQSNTTLAKNELINESEKLLEDSKNYRFIEQERIDIYLNSLDKYLLENIFEEVKSTFALRSNKKIIKALEEVLDELKK